MPEWSIGGGRFREAERAKSTYGCPIGRGAAEVHAMQRVRCMHASRCVHLDLPLIRAGGQTGVSSWVLSVGW